MLFYLDSKVLTQRINIARGDIEKREQINPESERGRERESERDSS